MAGMRIVGRAALRLHELAKPTIAAVNGVAAGAGCNLALGCDLIVASDRARFSEIFSKRGLVVDFGGSWLLPRLVGLHRAKELVFLADIIDATEAERIGLVNRVVAHDQLVDEVRDARRRGWRRCRRSQLALIEASAQPGARRCRWPKPSSRRTSRSRLMLDIARHRRGMIAFVEAANRDFTGDVAASGRRLERDRCAWSARARGRQLRGRAPRPGGARRRATPRRRSSTGT